MRRICVLAGSAWLSLPCRWRPRPFTFIPELFRNWVVHARAPAGGGGRIAFTSIDGAEAIYVMDADGGGQTKLPYFSDMDTGPVWSPDGSKVPCFHPGRQLRFT